MLKDSFQRPIDYLRVSVTDRCNLRCVYCMPEAGVPQFSHAAVLRYEEIIRIVKVAGELGFSHIRLTGGEPLVRKDIVSLVESVSNLPGIDDLSMTTNGILLPRYAAALAQAGLKRVNISLDTLNPERFHKITRLGNLAQTLSGWHAAHEAGLAPIKVNMVVIRDLNDDEVVDMARLSLQPDWHIRFIEVMPLGDGVHWSDDGVVPTDEVRGRIEAELGTLTPVARLGKGVGPARYYRLPGAQGTLGFISALTHHFCYACNRLRLTSDGRLLPCLMSNKFIDLRTPLRAGVDDTGLRELFQQAVKSKPQGHHLAEHATPDSVLPMSCIGG